MSLEEYIEFFRCTMHTQTWQITGEARFDHASTALPRYSVLAPYERLAQAAASLAEILDQDIPLVRINATAYPERADMTSAQRAQLKPKIAEDLKLYEYVARQWERQAA
jgi:hypothetical protein